MCSFAEAHLNVCCLKSVYIQSPKLTQAGVPGHGIPELLEAWLLPLSLPLPSSPGFSLTSAVPLSDSFTGSGKGTILANMPVPVVIVRKF